MTRSSSQLSDSRKSHHVFVGGILGTDPLGSFLGLKS